MTHTKDVSIQRLRRQRTQKPTQQMLETMPLWGQAVARHAKGESIQQNKYSRRAARDLVEILTRIIEEKEREDTHSSVSL